MSINLLTKKKNVIFLQSFRMLFVAREKWAERNNWPLKFMTPEMLSFEKYSIYCIKILTPNNAGVF